MKLEITAFQAQFPNAKFLISGDFNSRIGQLTDTPDTINSLREVPYLNEDELGLFGTDSDVPPRMNCDKHVNTYGKQLIDLCVESELVICNGRSGRDRNLGSFTCYTAFGASVVDYILVTTSFFNHVADFEVLPITTYSIHAQLKFNVMLQDSQKSVFCDQINDFRTNSYQLEPRVRYIIPKEGMSEFSQNFRDKFNDITSATNENLHPSEMLNVLYNMLYETAVNYKRTTKPFTKIQNSDADSINIPLPYFDLDCLLKKRKMEKIQQDIRMLNIQNQANNLYDTQISVNVKLLHEAKQDFKLTLESKEKAFFEKESREILAATESDTGFWEYYKKKCPKSYNTANKVPPEEWVKHTQTLYSRPVLEIPTFEGAIIRNNDFLDSPFTVKEITDQTRKVKLKKSCGPDGLGGGILIGCFETIVFYLVTMFNSMYTLCSYPIQWTNSIIFMLFKKGDKSDPNNYRSISLLNILSKVFTGLLQKRLMIWCDNENIISEFQFGFRSNHSTIDSIFIHNTLIHSQLSKKRKKLYTCYIDFTKAFDSVVWEILWRKLAHMGISENSKFLKMLKAIYASVTSQILTPFGLTPTVQLFRGLRQGCLLSPLLFSLFINDIKKHLEEVDGHEMFLGNISITHLLFADDLVLFSQTPIGLQRFLNCLEKYCARFHLTINLSKTCIIVFRRGGKPAKSEKWFIKNHPISVVSQFKYLGIVFSPTGSWFHAQKDLANRARKAMFLIKKFVAKTRFRNPLILFKIFDSCVLPILNYGCETWGFHEGKDVEKVYNDFCKFVAGLPTSTCNIAARGEFGRKRLIHYRFCRIIKYWIKLLNENCNPILKIAYNEQLRLDSAGHNVWASDVRVLLCSLGFSELWHSQSVPNQNIFFKEFKERLACLELNMFELEKNKFHRLFLFSQLKTLSLSCHWSSDIPFYLQNTFSKFICSAHKLAIETGRKQHTPRHMRICMLCDRNEIEDEFHFVLICPWYTDLRNRYIPDEFKTQPSWNKLISMLINPNYLKPVMFFLHSAFQKREKSIEAILYH